MFEVIKKNQNEADSWKLKIDGGLVRGISFFREIFVDPKHSSIAISASFYETSPIFFDQSLSDLLCLVDVSIREVQIRKFAETLLKNELKELLWDRYVARGDYFQFNISFFLNSKLLLSAKIQSMAFTFNAWWNLPFSLAEYVHYVQYDIWNEVQPSKLTGFHSPNEIYFNLPELIVTLREGIDYVLERYKASHEKAFRELSQKHLENSLVTKFVNFPEEIKIPCEQYLLYFTEFLRDLGINATSDIKHEAGEILFSVRPADPNHALDKIRVALEAFLSLPTSEIVIDPDPEFEIAMHKVKANVDHLNSQLSLAKAEIRVKERELQAFEATVEAKDISIEFLRENLVNKNAS